MIDNAGRSRRTEIEVLTHPTLAEIEATTVLAKEVTLNTKIPTALTFTGSDVKATLDGEKVTLSNATEGQIDVIETITGTILNEKLDTLLIRIPTTIAIALERVKSWIVGLK